MTKSTKDAKTMQPDTRYEKLDYTPVKLPFGHKKPESLAEQIRRIVRSEQLAKEAQRFGRGTFEEEDDFTDDEEGDTPPSPHELRELDGIPEAPEVQAALERRSKGKPRPSTGRKSTEAPPKSDPPSQPADDADGKNDEQ